MVVFKATTHMKKYGKRRLESCWCAKESLKTLLKLLLSASLQCACSPPPVVAELESKCCYLLDWLWMLIQVIIKATKIIFTKFEALLCIWRSFILCKCSQSNMCYTIHPLPIKKKCRVLHNHTIIRSDLCCVSVTSHQMAVSVLQFINMSISKENVDKNHYHIYPG